jgi:hypothetical protein
MSSRSGLSLTVRRPAVRDGVPRSEAMKYELLQSVVLARDIPEQGLRRGDLGTVGRALGARRG